MNKQKTIIIFLVVVAAGVALLMIDFDKLLNRDGEDVSVAEIEAEVDESSFELEQAEKSDNLDDDIPDFVD